MYYSTPVMNAIENTPGARVLDGGRIELQVSRYQKPEQGGSPSVRTGVFYLPELKSPYGKHYKSSYDNPNSAYGGSQYITGTIVLKKPYTLQAGTGGLGPQKAFIELYGKDMYKELESDIFEMVVNRMPWGKKVNHMVMEEWIQEFMEKWEGDPDLAYAIAEHSNEGNRMRYALQEHIIAHKIRDKGFDSVLSYSKHKGEFHLSEVFDLRQMEYPYESGFLIEQHHNKLYNNIITTFNSFISYMNESYIKPSGGLIYLTQDITYANAYAMGMKSTAHKGVEHIRDGVIFVIWLDENIAHWGGDIWENCYRAEVVEDLKEYKRSGRLSTLLSIMFESAGIGSDINQSNIKYLNNMIKDPIILLQCISPNDWSGIQDGGMGYSEVCVKSVEWNQIIEIRVYKDYELVDTIQGGMVDIDLMEIEPEDYMNIFYHGSPLHLWQSKLLR
jgi:hypothetical protein